MNTQDPSQDPSQGTPAATPVDEEAALKAFKAEFVKPGSHVLDAWLSRGFIEYHVDPDQFAANMGKVPFEYMGVPTIITLFPREDD